MISIKQMAACMFFSPLNVGGVKWPKRFSLLHDFFGYHHSPKQDPLGILTRVSLLKQVRLLKGKHLHLNLIRVGSENFKDADLDDIDFALRLMRDIYATADLGIGRVLHSTISVANAVGFDVIDSDAETYFLTLLWTVPNDGLDVFLVLEPWGITLGTSPILGPCNKYKADAITGVVVSTGGVKTTLAHEVAHYLGLPHIIELVDVAIIGYANLPAFMKVNLMFPTGTIFNDELIGFQKGFIKAGCFVRSGC